MYKFLAAAAVLFAGSAYAADAESHYLGISFHQGEPVYFDLTTPSVRYDASIEGEKLKITPVNSESTTEYSCDIADVDHIFNTTENMGGSVSIKDISANSSVITPLGDNRFAVTNAEGLAVYSTDGRAAAASVTTDGAKTIVDLSSLTPGVYVITFGGNSLKVSKR